MAKIDKLPFDYEDAIEQRFGKRTEIVYRAKEKTIHISLDYASESWLTFENYKFLADLFKTSKVNTGMWINAGSGCPTCGNDGPEIGGITFEVSDVVIE